MKVKRIRKSRKRQYMNPPFSIQWKIQPLAEVNIFSFQIDQQILVERTWPNGKLSLFYLSITLFAILFSNMINNNTDKEFNKINE